MAKRKSGRYVAGGTGPSGTFRGLAGRYDTFKEASAAAKKFVAKLPLAHGDVLDTKTGKTRRVRDVSAAQRAEMKHRAKGYKKLPKNWPAGRPGPWADKSGSRWTHVGNAYVDTGKGKSIEMEIFGRRSPSGALLKHESKILFRRTSGGKVIASIVIDPRNKTLLDIHETKSVSKKEIHLALKEVLAMVSMKIPKKARRF